MQDLQINYVYVARILDIMAIRKRDIAHITLREVERPRSSRSGEDRHPRIARDKEIPFIAIGVPVDLTHSSWLDGDERDTEIGSDWEGRGVQDLHGAAIDDVGFLLGEVVGVGVGGYGAGWAGDVLCG